MTEPAAIVATARGLADDVLFPAAAQTDSADAVPAAQLSALAAAGLYGITGPAEAGGMALDLATRCAVTEELASGCLATTFVWSQHFGLAGALAAADTPPALRRSLLGPACRGDIRGGIALAGLIPGPPGLRARPARGGWLVEGTAPWVTGWGLIDVVLVVARGPGDTIVSLIMDAAAQPGLSVARMRLAAADASATVRLGFTGVLIPGDRLARTEPFDPAAHSSPDRLRMNGSLALGIARRCCRLLGDTPLDGELTACRERLGRAGHADLPGARAAASELALRAAAALAVRDGSGSITTGAHPQRLVREAMFLLVFGSRPAIKTELLGRLGATATEPRTDPA